MKAYELLDQKSKWCQGIMAIKADGTACNSHNKQAVAWCALGSISKCYSRAALMLIMVTRLRECVGRDIMRWNDSTTYENVRATLLKLDI